MDYVLNLLFLVLGFALLIKGADFFVDGSSSIAKIMKIPTVIIGLTIVSIGTSLPELVTSVVAARKGESEIALGNVVGSNIFNILFILGMSGIVHPLSCDIGALIDTVLLIGVCLIMYFVCISDKKATRPEGYVCILLYIIYVIYAVIRAYI